MTGVVMPDGQAAAKVAAAEHERHIEQIAAVTGETVEYLREQVAKLVATFVGLPGVTGAPMLMGPDYYTEVAIHQVECGARVPADPIKRYEAPTDLSPAGAAGKWVYLDDENAPSSPRERYARQRAAELAEYRAELARQRAAKKKRK